MSPESIYKHFKPAVKQPTGDNDPAYWFVFRLNKLLVMVEKDKATIPYFRSLSELNIATVRIQYLGTLEGQPMLFRGGNHRNRSSRRNGIQRSEIFIWRLG